MLDFGSDTLETLAELCTAGVIIGLAIEYVLPVFSYFKKPWYERGRLSSALLHLVGPILVVAGIAGELLFHHETNKLQRETIIELTARIAPRKILPNERSEIAKSLKGMAKIPFAFIINPSPEPKTLMFEIAEILESDSWKWINCPLSENSEGCGAIGHNIAGTGHAVGTRFDISDVVIEIPDAKLAEWGNTISMLEKKLALVPGIVVSTVLFKYVPASSPFPAGEPHILILVGIKS